MNRSFLLLCICSLSLLHCGGEANSGRSFSSYQEHSEAVDSYSDESPQDNQQALERNLEEPSESQEAQRLAEWSCPIAYYGSGDGCDEGCGLVDPDCTGGIEGWNCDASWYGTGDGCDSGCGVTDPDCI